jgi:hypothetical protein
LTVGDEKVERKRKFINALNEIILWINERKRKEKSDKFVMYKELTQPKRRLMCVSHSMKKRNFR